MKNIQVQCQHCEAAPESVSIADQSICYIHTCPDCESDTVVETKSGKIISQVVGNKAREIRDILWEKFGINCKVRIEVTESETREQMIDEADYTI